MNSPFRKAVKRLDTSAVTMLALVSVALAFTAAPTWAAESTCVQNLKNIYGAIQSYREAHLDLPARLSDLVPDFLSDQATLNCPVAQSRGINSYQAADWTLAERFDPRTTYIYEFGTNPIPSVIKGGAGRSMRDLKRAQMSLVGGRIPMVRCLVHGPAINLSFDGEIYESAKDWEQRFQQVVSKSDLAPVRRLAGGPVRVVFVPPRDPQTPARLINLEQFYNASLSRNWSSSSMDGGCHLGSLPTGRQTLAGTAFDVRGLIQLQCEKYVSALFPVSVPNIPIEQRCARLQFLHAAAWEPTQALVETIGIYRIHFDGGRVMEVPIISGRHVLDWRSTAKFKGDPDSVVAWRGHYTSDDGERKAVALYRTTWTNPAPETLIRRLDLIATLGTDGVPTARIAPFLVALTAEP